ncbi:uncharacterized protein BYT42DRAFT_547568 [Radiomyces spectabilis]|uniref:uncharacterized protein n=1 Tax=Radiomyces spectabilis TaxID=64574 RepID=UPI0022210D36|nr:uncharacterized protein BYT42DRAFT_547568 [Radiomyces spectabilis]KAI8374539.1 hypothetical protein BYT42DRAFT_547568 [Radiomyces spectabilis]
MTLHSLLAANCEASAQEHHTEEIVEASRENQKQAKLMVSILENEIPLYRITINYQHARTDFEPCSTTSIPTILPEDVDLTWLDFSDDFGPDSSPFDGDGKGISRRHYLRARK